jgi:hypothetical protein
MMFNEMNKSGSKRGQAAMEYLMTYGWAILVIVIVLAILTFLLPSVTKVPESCQFSDLFGCDQSALLSQSAKNNTVLAAFSLKNGKGKPVVVKKVLCTTASFADSNESHAKEVEGPDGVTLLAGSTKTFDASYEIECVDKQGNLVQMQENSGFRGTLVIYYNFDPDVIGDVFRTSDAVLTGTVLKG